MKKKTLSIIATTLFSMVLVSCGSSTWSWDDAKADGELNYVLLIGQIDHNDSAARTAGIRDALGTRAANATANANTEDPVPGTLTLGGVEYDTIELEHAEQKAQGGATWDQATATSTAEAWINKHGSDNDVCVSLTIFFSLGVAGIILIAGTDLSIGRMTGLTAIIASIVMSNRVFETNQGWVLDFTSLPDFGKIVVALILAIIFAVIFSALAGFFTARFKMHPFITTLSTQLLIFGLMMIFFSNVPSFRINSNLKSLLAGERNTNIIIASVIAVAIMWFIWNKTKFGKNMYAVGGNSEAAIVSGINVFAVTMSIFMMAGVLYGVGGFFEAIRVGTAQPNTGAGTELDAIAACVVGGISFSGGIGKIRGAVIGTIIFTGITYTLTYLGYDPNIQFVFKGIIIMAAVCLDSLKYLRKK